MISQPTVLVVGAGASVSYGYPSGADLRSILCDKKRYTALINAGEFISSEVDVFYNTFRDSGVASIDAFLANRGEHIVHPHVDNPNTFATIGKSAIKQVILESESEQKLFDSSNQDPWLEYLWNRLCDIPVQDFGCNKLSIVTFNYDRLLEFALVTFAKNTYGLGDTEAEDLIAKHIKIIHVYGQAANGPVRSDNAKKYGAVTQDYQVTRRVSSSIRVIPEARSDDSIFDEASKFIASAQILCFLGFGFDQINVNRLRIRGVLSAEKRYATTYGMQLAERGWVRSILNADDQFIHPEYSKMKCREYLRATGALGVC
jgi:hypothetical protein